MRPLLVHYAERPGKAACGAEAQAVSVTECIVSCANCRRSGTFIRSELWAEFFIETDEEVLDV